MNNEQSPQNPVILNVIQHCHNPSEYTEINCVHKYFLLLSLIYSLPEVCNSMISSTTSFAIYNNMSIIVSLKY